MEATPGARGRGERGAASDCGGQTEVAARREKTTGGRLPRLPRRGGAARWVSIGWLVGVGVAALVAGRVVEAVGESTSRGCTCVGECSRSLDSLTQTWCYTSATDPPSDFVGCGLWSESRRAYWDDCTVNVTTFTPHVYLSTFRDVWYVITVSCTGACAVAYFIAGAAASCLTSPRKTMWWLPAGASCLGAVTGFLVGAIFAALVAFMYMSLPYAIDISVAISLGIGLAALLTFSGLGRQVQPTVAPDGSAYAES